MIKVVKKGLYLLLSFCLIAAPVLADEKAAENQISELSILPIPNKYDWNNVEEWKEARKKLEHKLRVLSIYEEEKQSKTVNFLKSLIVPGWGHISADEHTRGEILVGLEIFTVASAIYFYDKSSDYYSRYKNANNVQDISQYYTDANTAYQNYQALLAVMIFIWGYGVLDSFRATSDYNDALWNDLSLEYKGATLEVKPFKLNIRF